MSIETKKEGADLERFPVPDPGIEEHIERWTDADQAAGNRVYRQVLLMLGAVPVLAIVFVVLYFALPRNSSIDLLGMHWDATTFLLGLTGGLATLLIGLACIHWAKTIMGDEEVAEDRHAAASSEADREVFAAEFAKGAEQSGLGRRKLIGGALGGALGLIAVPAVVLFADMGPWPTGDVRKRTIEKTIWAEGVKLVNDVTRKPLKASDLELGQLVNAQPENLWDHHGADFQIEKAKAAIIIVRMDPSRIKIPESRKDWQVGGILCYSKICTHVGCPISLWEQQTHHLLCPCHQSTFDLGNSGVVVFGPAARALPQLPITVDADGYLVARSDFTVPVGPSYFERNSSGDFKEGDR
ncbi:MAG: Rieske 2Fe-2S domain-containing protein [Micropruina sp.]|uniref:cytochrome bc1 complex Rieske iron-sulfur subunit n=1 Tax=Micropruina sp. TaxID=2737536 RepID=UPI0039E41B9B